MTSITRSLLSASALLLEYQKLGSCNSEDELRTILMSAFMHAREAHLSCTLLREEYAKGKDFDKRLDLIMLPSWPPHQKAVAAGEMKFFPLGTARNYRTRIGARLSDIHLAESLASKEKLHGFFFDLVLDPKLVGKNGYESIRKMCRIAADLLYSPIEPLPPSQLAHQTGIKAFATATKDRTPRKRLQQVPYGFLFPPMDLPCPPEHYPKATPAKRGSAVVKTTNKEGLISIGVRKSGKEKIVPYRAFTTRDGLDVAICFAVFEPGGHLAATTNDLMMSMAKR